MQFQINAEDNTIFETDKPKEASANDKSEKAKNEVTKSKEAKREEDKNVTGCQCEKKYCKCKTKFAIYRDALSGNSTHIANLENTESSESAKKKRRVNRKNINRIPKTNSRTRIYNKLLASTLF